MPYLILILMAVFSTSVWAEDECVDCLVNVGKGKSPPKGGDRHSAPAPAPAAGAQEARGAPAEASKQKCAERVPSEMQILIAERAARLRESEMLHAMSAEERAKAVQAEKARIAQSFPELDKVLKGQAAGRPLTTDEQELLGYVNYLMAVNIAAPELIKKSESDGRVQHFLNIAASRGRDLDKKRARLALADYAAAEAANAENAKRAEAKQPPLSEVETKAIIAKADEQSFAQLDAYLAKVGPAFDLMRKHGITYADEGWNFGVRKKVAYGGELVDERPLANLKDPKDKDLIETLKNFMPESLFDPNRTEAVEIGNVIVLPPPSRSEDGRVGGLGPHTPGDWGGSRDGELRVMRREDWVAGVNAESRGVEEKIRAAVKKSAETGELGFGSDKNKLNIVDIFAGRVPENEAGKMIASTRPALERLRYHYGMNAHEFDDFRDQFYSAGVKENANDTAAQAAMVESLYEGTDSFAIYNSKDTGLLKRGWRVLRVPLFASAGVKAGVTPLILPFGLSGLSSAGKAYYDSRDYGGDFSCYWARRFLAGVPSNLQMAGELYNINAALGAGSAVTRLRSAAAANAVLQTGHVLTNSYFVANGGLALVKQVQTAWHERRLGNEAAEAHDEELAKLHKHEVDTGLIDITESGTMAWMGYKGARRGLTEAKAGARTWLITEELQRAERNVPGARSSIPATLEVATANGTRTMSGRFTKASAAGPMEFIETLPDGSTARRILKPEEIRRLDNPAHFTADRVPWAQSKINETLAKEAGLENILAADRIKQGNLYFVDVDGEPLPLKFTGKNAEGSATFEVPEEFQKSAGRNFEPYQFTPEGLNDMIRKGQVKQQVGQSRPSFLRQLGRDFAGTLLNPMRKTLMWMHLASPESMAEFGRATEGTAAEQNRWTGEVQWDLKKIRQARAYYEKAMERDPSLKPALEADLRRVKMLEAVALLDQAQGKGLNSKQLTDVNALLPENMRFGPQELADSAPVVVEAAKVPEVADQLDAAAKEAAKRQTVLNYKDLAPELKERGNVKARLPGRREGDYTVVPESNNVRFMADGEKDVVLSRSEVDTLAADGRLARSVAPRSGGVNAALRQQLAKTLAPLLSSWPDLKARSPLLRKSAHAGFVEAARTAEAAGDYAEAERRYMQAAELRPEYQDGMKADLRRVRLRLEADQLRQGAPLGVGIDLDQARRINGLLDKSQQVKLPPVQQTVDALYKDANERYAQAKEAADREAEAAAVDNMLRNVVENNLPDPSPSVQAAEGLARKVQQSRGDEVADAMGLRSLLEYREITPEVAAKARAEIARARARLKAQQAEQLKAGDAAAAKAQARMPGEIQKLSESERIGVAVLPSVEDLRRNAGLETPAKPESSSAPKADSGAKGSQAVDARFKGARGAYLRARDAGESLDEIAAIDNMLNNVVESRFDADNPSVRAAQTMARQIEVRRGAAAADAMGLRLLLKDRLVPEDVSDIRGSLAKGKKRLQARQEAELKVGDSEAGRAAALAREDLGKMSDKDRGSAAVPSTSQLREEQGFVGDPKAQAQLELAQKALRAIYDEAGQHFSRAEELAARDGEIEAIDNMLRNAQEKNLGSDSPSVKGALSVADNIARRGNTVVTEMGLKKFLLNRAKITPEVIAETRQSLQKARENLQAKQAAFEEAGKNTLQKIASIEVPTASPPGAARRPTALPDLNINGGDDAR